MTTAVEHPAILALCEYLESKRGVRVTRVGVASDGSLEPGVVSAHSPQDHPGCVPRLNHEHVVADGSCRVENAAH